MNRLIISIVVVLAILAGLLSSVYVVSTGEKGIVLRFNKIIEINNPGLHFKVPFIDKVQRIDSKIQTATSPSSEEGQRLFVKGNRIVIIDYYIQWQIDDFEKYYETVHNGTTDVEKLMFARLAGVLRSEIGKLDVQDLLTETSSLDTERNALMKRVKDLMNGVDVSNIDIDVDTASVNDFGIKVIDVRIKKINFPTEVSQAIFTMMKQERNKLATEYRSKGEREYNKLIAETDTEKERIISSAQQEALIIRGQADANVAKMYADAFNKDKEFFNFIRSLKAYEASFDNNDVLVISPDSEFFQYMKLSNKH